MQKISSKAKMVRCRHSLSTNPGTVDQLHYFKSEFLVWIYSIWRYIRFWRWKSTDTAVLGFFKGIAMCYLDTYLPTLKTANLGCWRVCKMSDVNHISFVVNEILSTVCQSRSSCSKTSKCINVCNITYYLGILQKSTGIVASGHFNAIGIYRCDRTYAICTALHGKIF